MTTLPFHQRFVVARVLARHAERRTDTDYDDAVLAALGKWVDLEPLQITVLPPSLPQTLLLQRAAEIRAR